MIANVNEGHYDTLITLAPLAPVELTIEDISEIAARVRSLRWRWEGIYLYLDLIVDQDEGLLAGGAGPFVLGSSALGSGFLWV